jgi:hypothetical protein
MDPERIRLQATTRGTTWRKWGPYLSERQWGTVREDYSDSGNAWDYFSHDQARSRAYRWSEDGIAGFSDDKQRLCFCLGLWNERDPILKERLFGLTNSEGNHGEDVKEYYFYLDSTPTHSYAKYLYKYPQNAYPYDDIVKTNRSRGRLDPEYELLDTGVFDRDRYFDVFVEYAKESPEELLIRVTVCNRSPEPARLHLLPQWWFRDVWTAAPNAARPRLNVENTVSGQRSVLAVHPELGACRLDFDGEVPLLFTENATNEERIFGRPNPQPYVKDAFDNYVVHGRKDAVNPAQRGTKMAAHYVLDVPARGQTEVRLRLREVAWDTTGAFVAPPPKPFGAEFDEIVARRVAEADAFYAPLLPAGASADERNVLRQALAGMLWSKQYYYFDLEQWLSEHGHAPLLGKRRFGVRNSHWLHMENDHVISMPDKWEYPWYAAWDLAFHAVALDTVDPEFAKQQLALMLDESYLHPTGQLPAYEWNFGDVNPPVHAFATIYTYRADKAARGQGDRPFLQAMFHKLLLNFSWWANRKDPRGQNVFEGGFLGLDNIGVFDRSSPLPTGGFLEQADGTAWMAMFAQQMFEMGLELAQEDPAYERLAHKFLEHFLWIAGSMDRVGDNQDELWDEEDGFFYDVLNMPNGDATRLKVRSMVGLLPLCAVSVVPESYLERFPEMVKRARSFIERYPSLVANVHPPHIPGYGGRRMLAVCNRDKLRRILTRMLDEQRFLSPQGIRSLSRFHLDHPYEFWVKNDKYSVKYMPAESETGMFGGNSNWRGPIWFPVNLLIVASLAQYYMYYGESFRIECPTGSGKMMNLYEVAQEIARRLVSGFLRGPDGKRPVYGNAAKFQDDPYWRDLLLFYEYFHGDTGLGLGASHQTGWTGVVARLARYAHYDPKVVLEQGLMHAAVSKFEDTEPAPDAM